MHVPSQSLPGYWPQLSEWKIKAGEVPATDRPAMTFTGIRNRLPEGHAIRLESLPSQTNVLPDGAGCRTMEVNDYVRNVLTTLVTPKEGCPSRRYARNAELLESVANALALHPQGGEALLEARIRAIGLPSLLRDDPEYLPGTLHALRFDVGSRIVAIGRSELPDLAEAQAPDDLALHVAGARELSYLDSENPSAAQVVRDHRQILDFHYRAAGAAAPVSITGPSPDPSAHERHIADFIVHLKRCRQPSGPRPARPIARGRIPLRSGGEASRVTRKVAKHEPPQHPLSRDHDILYNCTLL